MDKTSGERVITLFKYSYNYGHPLSEKMAGDF